MSGEHSLVFPVIRKFALDCFDKVIREQVTPWVFMTAGPEFRLKDFHGRQITYQGIEFEGSPQHVFWGRYIEPFLEDLSFRTIDLAMELSSDRKIELPPILEETSTLLLEGIERVYREMADVDCRLRGKGRPNSVEVKNFGPYVGRMKEFVRQRVDGEIALCRPKPKLQRFYENHKFLILLAAPILVLLGLVIGVIRLFL